VQLVGGAGRKVADGRTPELNLNAGVAPYSGSGLGVLADDVPVIRKPCAWLSREIIPEERIRELWTLVPERFASRESGLADEVGNN
jgi:hypothetical protein